MSEQIVYIQNPNFPNRYISPESLFNYLQSNYAPSIICVGFSYMNKPIYRMSLGNGPIRVLAWSQMHGNESNSTHAMLDLLEIFNKQPTLVDDLYSKIILDFIFMLNPDGSEKWTRRNAMDIDLNRDFIKSVTPEMIILKNIVENVKYDYALNLHEQRTVFSADANHPATLSFLAPAQNIERTVTETRKKTKAVIGRIYKKLKSSLPNQIARYSDEFYPNSVGDNLTILGIPSILFEGGHFLDDYKRFETRKYYTLALYECLLAISDLNSSTEGWETYHEIPENQESHFDLIYRNVRLKTDFECVVDIAVQYKEEILDNSEEISFTPIVVEVGDVGFKKGWKEVDCRGKSFISERKFPKLDAVVDFKIE